MQLKISKEVLKEGLLKVNAVVTSKATIPILTGILLHATKEEVILIGSDGTETVKHCLPVDGEVVDVVEEGAAVVPSRFLTIVKKLNKEINIFHDDSNMKIKSGKSLFELNCMDATEYPKFVEFNLDEPCLTMSSSEFKGIIQKTSFSASKAETRPILTGVHFKLGDKITVSATDSHRLSQISCDKELSGDLEVVIPAKTVEGLLKVIESDDVCMYLDKHQVMYKTGATFYSSRVLDGNYPEISRLIPNGEDFNTVVEMNKSELLQSLELASIASEKNGVVKLELKENAAILSSNEETSKSNVEITLSSMEGKELIISFNASYMIEALKSMDTEEVTVSFNNDQRPFILHPSDIDEYNEIQLILPVRTY